MDRARGALVVETLTGSPAEAAGIKPLDVVLSINQQAVNQFADLPVIVSRLPAGDTHYVAVVARAGRA